MKKLKEEDKEALASFAILGFLSGVVLTLVAASFIWGPFVLLGVGILGMTIGSIPFLFLDLRPEEEQRLDRINEMADAVASVTQPRGTTAEQAEASGDKTHEDVRTVGLGGGAPPGSVLSTRSGLFR